MARKGFLSRLWDAITGTPEPRKETAPPPPVQILPETAPEVRPEIRSTPRVEEYVPTSTDDNERIANHLIRELQGKRHVNPNAIRRNVEKMSPEAKEFARRARREDIEYQAQYGEEYLDDDGNSFFFYH